MKYLLDTHAFLWSVTRSKALPEKVISELKNPHNEVFISAVSFWEIAIKTRIKKLDLGGLPIEDLISLAEKMDFQLIDLTPEEASTYVNLAENTHNDPFDRMLIWQCIRRNMTIVSKDGEFEKFKDFGLKILWSSGGLTGD
ncbi:MAG: type II toxin-antitoxin system VapC family toxin [Patescibacteria group bacterium]